jgi:Nif-specific regulatory protein
MPHTALPTSEATVDWHAQELLLLSQVVRGLGRGAGGGVDSSVVLREMLHLMSELLGLNRGRIVLAVGDGDGDDTAGPLQAPFGAARPASAGAPSSRIQHAYGLTREEVARGRYGPGEGVTGRVLGTARCRRLQVEDGGQITGQIEMITDAPRPAAAPGSAPAGEPARPADAS